MASPLDNPAAPDAATATPTGAPRCAGCNGPLCPYEDGLGHDREEELSRPGEADAAREVGARDTWQPGDEIPRGLPRPVYKGRPLPWAEISERSSPFGDPLDSDAAQSDERLDDGFWLGPQAQLQDAERLDEAWRDALCVLCGEPLGGEVHFFTEDWRTLAQGGLHPRCARLTRAHCAGVNDHGWTLASAPRAAWDELRQGLPGLGGDSGMEAPVPDQCEPIPSGPLRPNNP